MKGWGWFYVPVFKVQPLTFGYAVALAYFTRFFFLSYISIADIKALDNMSNDTDEKKKVKILGWIRMLTNDYVIPILILCGSWILHLIIG
jgi:hypothetical protein